MWFIGIDPGTQGAICLLNSQTNISTIMETPSSKNLGPTVRSLNTWFKEIRLFCGTEGVKIAVEDVHSLHGMSAKSNFQFGRNLAFVEMLAHLFYEEVEYITPKVWQKECGIVFDYSHMLLPTSSQKSTYRKNIIANTAVDLYPTAMLWGPMGGLKDGRADALMIAHCLSLRHGESNETSQ